MSWENTTTSEVIDIWIDNAGRLRSDRPSVPRPLRRCRLTALVKSGARAMWSKPRRSTQLPQDLNYFTPWINYEVVSP